MAQWERVLATKPGTQVQCLDPHGRQTKTPNCPLTSTCETPPLTQSKQINNAVIRLK